MEGFSGTLLTANTSRQVPQKERLDGARKSSPKLHQVAISDGPHPDGSKLVRESWYILVEPQRRRQMCVG